MEKEDKEAVLEQLEELGATEEDNKTGDIFFEDYENIYIKTEKAEKADNRYEIIVITKKYAYEENENGGMVLRLRYSKSLLAVD